MSCQNWLKGPHVKSDTHTTNTLAGKMHKNCWLVTCHTDTYIQRRCYTSSKTSLSVRLKVLSDDSRMSRGSPLYRCTVLYSRRRLPALVLTRGRAKWESWRVLLERSTEFAESWEERACGSPVLRILWRRLRDWTSYSWRAVSQPSSSRTSDILSYFRRSETARDKNWALSGGAECYSLIRCHRPPNSIGRARVPGRRL